MLALSFRSFSLPPTDPFTPQRGPQRRFRRDRPQESCYFISSQPLFEKATRFSLNSALTARVLPGGSSSGSRYSLTWRDFPGKKKNCFSCPRSVSSPGLRWVPFFSFFVGRPILGPQPQDLRNLALFSFGHPPDVLTSLIQPTPRQHRPFLLVNLLFFLALIHPRSCRAQRSPSIVFVLHFLSPVRSPSSCDQVRR